MLKANPRCRQRWIEVLWVRWRIPRYRAQRRRITSISGSWPEFSELARCNRSGGLRRNLDLRGRAVFVLERPQGRPYKVGLSVVSGVERRGGATEFLGFGRRWRSWRCGMSRHSWLVCRAPVCKTLFLRRCVILLSHTMFNRDRFFFNFSLSAGVRETLPTSTLLTISLLTAKLKASVTVLFSAIDKISRTVPERGVVRLKVDSWLTTRPTGILSYKL